MSESGHYPKDSTEWSDMAQLLWEDKVRDLNGYYNEAWTEQPNHIKRAAAETIIAYSKCSSDRIGDLQMVLGLQVRIMFDNLEPTDEEIRLALDKKTV